MELVVFLTILAVAVSSPAPYKDPMVNEGLFEGDIYGIDPYADRNAVVDPNRRWPQGIVPYYLTPQVEHMRGLIRKAMEHIEAYSCIRFVESSPADRDYVKIIRDNGCYSNWGRTGGQQVLSLGIGCENFAIILHELMHAIGFEHEHIRSDRDDYLIINWENIQENFYYAFRKLHPDQNRLLTQFDMSSIMLHGSTSFAKDPRKFSMIFRDGRQIEEIYQRQAMSVLDARRINILYQCPERELLN